MVEKRCEFTLFIPPRGFVVDLFLLFISKLQSRKETRFI